MIAEPAALLYAAARWWYYAALFVVAGAAVARWVVLPRAGAAAGPLRRAVTLARLASVVLAAAVLIRLYFQSRSLIEPDEALTRELLRAVLESSWGRGWLAQGAATLVALAAWRSVGRQGESAAGRIATWIAAIGLAAASPLTGHAVGLPAAGRIGYPLMVVHVAAGATWLGTLGVLWFAALGRADQGEAGDRGVVSAYSPVALVAGLGAMAAGLVVAWLYLGGLEPLITTPYGRTLLFKVATLGGVAATGSYNWKVVLPRLVQGHPAPVRRSATIELAFGLALLAVTALLVALAAPGEHAG